MAYTLTDFTDYVEREGKFLSPSLFSGGDTGRFAFFMGGVKGKTEIPTIDGEATLQASTCTTTTTGTTTVGLYSIEVTQWSMYEKFCNQDLQAKLPKSMLAPGSNNHETPKAMEEVIIENKIASINKQLEITYWQGDTSGATYTLFDGFIKQFDAATGGAAPIDGNPDDITAVTVSNIEAVVDAIILLSPEDVKDKDDYVVLLGNDWFDMYIQAMKNKNNYHYNADNDGKTYRISGSDKVIQKVRGLSGTSRIFAGRGSQLVVGSDLEGEENKIEIFYWQEDKTIRMRVEAKSGVRATYTQEWVQFTLHVA